MMVMMSFYVQFYSGSKLVRFKFLNGLYGTSKVCKWDPNLAIWPEHSGLD